MHTMKRKFFTKVAVSYHSCQEQARLLYLSSYRYAETYKTPNITTYKATSPSYKIVFPSTYHNVLRNNKWGGPQHRLVKEADPTAV